MEMEIENHHEPVISPYDRLRYDFEPTIKIIHKLVSNEIEKINSLKLRYSYIHAAGLNNPFITWLKMNYITFKVVI